MNERHLPIRRYNLNHLAREILQRTAKEERVSYGTGTYYRATPWTNVSGDTEYNLQANNYGGRYTLTEHRKSGGDKHVFSFAPGQPAIQQSAPEIASSKSIDPVSLHYKLQRILLASNAAPDAVPEPVGAAEIEAEQYHESVLNWQLGKLSVMHLLDAGILRRKNVYEQITEAFESPDAESRSQMLHELFLLSRKTNFQTDDEAMFQMHLEDTLQERYAEFYPELEESAD